MLTGVQSQVELSGAAVPLQPTHLQATELGMGVAGSLRLVVEHHLEQRTVAHAALRLQRLHQLFER
ncbi:hypothetical protein D3C81_1676760 [compost metagenome]